MAANFELRPATERERLYAYGQSHELYMHTGCVGHLRGDFDSDGTGFFTTWFDHHGSKKTSEFKEEFDRVVNALREDRAYGGILASRSAMSGYCGNQPNSAMKGNYTTEYVFRVDSEMYAHILRCNPTKGDYNFYIFCYEKKCLDRHLMNSAKGVRFIDPHYKEKFRIPDGDRIRIIRSDGTSRDETVRFIDEYHIEVGFFSTTIFHICEFAERMEANGSKVIPLRRSLPDQCYTTLPSTGEIILVKKGEDGYFASGYPNAGAEENRRMVEELNAKSGVSKAQEAAMQAGSIFGWAAPAADPDSYDEDGKPIERRGRR